MDRRELGRRGERAAERLLRRAGLIILARNWRAAGGELDLAAMDGNTLVFVEVKARSNAFDPDHQPVAHRQQRRIASAARAFRGRYGVRGLPFRFDLITITGDPRRPRSLTWNQRYGTMSRQEPR